MPFQLFISPLFAILGVMVPLRSSLIVENTTKAPYRLNTPVRPRTFNGTFFLEICNLHVRL